MSASSYFGNCGQWYYSHDSGSMNEHAHHHIGIKSNDSLCMLTFCLQLEHPPRTRPDTTRAHFHANNWWHYQVIVVHDVGNISRTTFRKQTRRQNPIRILQRDPHQRLFAPWESMMTNMYNWSRCI